MRVLKLRLTLLINALILFIVYFFIDALIEKLTYNSVIELKLQENMNHEVNYETFALKLSKSDYIT